MIIIYENSDSSLKDANNKHMDMSGRGEIMI